jgi:hypothetical protein
LFEPAEIQRESLPQSEWLAMYGRHINNARAPLDWAFSSDGDAQLGVALTAAVVPLWIQLSLLSECRERVERALASLGADDETTAQLRMRLSAALRGGNDEQCYGTLSRNFRACGGDGRD